ncbi:MAG: FAD-dependent oxidoreductase [Dehalococcoidia bacterium]|nr:FAD-dependent oxidoreductase [Dehalococcoidia bacterium]
MFDLIILGGGPAALTAAVYAARKKLDILLITPELGGQPNRTTGVENYMGFQYIEGPELMDKFAAQIKQFPLQQKIGEAATRVSLNKKGKFEVATDQGGDYLGKSVIVATGKRPRTLNVPGEDKYTGKGVTYCAICDGPVFEGQKVAVIGGGNSALEAANDMIKIAEHVYLVSRTSLSADPVLVERAKKAKNFTVYTDHQVEDIEGDVFVKAVNIKNSKSTEKLKLEVGGVFVEIGLNPNSDCVKGLARLNKTGEIEIDCSCHTSIPGLFAAGDVTNTPEKQIVVAAGEGCKAALAAQNYLQRLA